jgi:hypothetical protein
MILSTCCYVKKNAVSFDELHNVVGVALPALADLLDADLFFRVVPAGENRRSCIGALNASFNPRRSPIASSSTGNSRLRGALLEADISTCAVASGPKCPRCTATCIGQHD